MFSYAKYKILKYQSKLVTYRDLTAVECKGFLARWLKKNSTRYPTFQRHYTFQVEMSPWARSTGRHAKILPFTASMQTVVQYSLLASARKGSVYSYQVRSLLNETIYISFIFRILAFPNTYKEPFSVQNRSLPSPPTPY